MSDDDEARDRLDTLRLMSGMPEFIDLEEKRYGWGATLFFCLVAWAVVIGLLLLIFH